MRLAPLLTCGVILFCAGLLSGCFCGPGFCPVQEREVEDNYTAIPVSNISQRLIEGDVVKIRTVEGKLHRFRVQAITDHSFVGVAANRKTYRVPYTTIAEIWIRRI